MAVNTFFAGTLKGVRKVYIQTVLDCFSRYVWARLYTSKMPVTAVQILNNHALPLFEEHAVKVQTILSDNGREYCGRPDQHPYELFHRTLLEEHLRIKGRTTWYETVAEMQEDLDAYLETYNTRRPTAAAAWRDGRPTRPSRRESSGSRPAGNPQPERRSRP